MNPAAFDMKLFETIGHVCKIRISILHRKIRKSDPAYLFQFLVVARVFIA